MQSRRAPPGLVTLWKNPRKASLKNVGLIQTRLKMVTPQAGRPEGGINTGRSEVIKNNLKAGRVWLTAITARELGWED